MSGYCATCDQEVAIPPPPILLPKGNANWKPQRLEQPGVVMDLRQVAGVQLGYDGSLWITHRERRLWTINSEHLAADLSRIPDAVVL